MIKNYKLFEAAKTKLARAFTDLKPRQAVELSEFLKKGAWQDMDASELAKVEKKVGMPIGAAISLSINIGKDMEMLKLMQNAYAKKAGATSWDEMTFETEQYKSDDDIAGEFARMTVSAFNMPGKYSNKMMGDIVLEFPEGGEHVGGGSGTVVEEFLYNKDTGEYKLAFSNWMPDDVCAEVSKEVERRIGAETGKAPVRIKYGQEWSDKRKEDDSVDTSED